MKTGAGRRGRISALGSPLVRMADRYVSFRSSGSGFAMTSIKSIITVFRNWIRRRKRMMTSWISGSRGKFCRILRRMLQFEMRDGSSAAGWETRPSGASNDGWRAGERKASWDASLLPRRENKGKRDKKGKAGNEVCKRLL